MLKNITRTLWNFRPSGAFYFSTHNINDAVEGEKSPFKTKLKNVDMSFETNKMYAAFPHILEHLLEEQLSYHQQFTELKTTYSNLLNHTVNLEPQLIGKGIFTVYAYKMLEKPLLLTEDNIKKACVVGWCHKLMDASLTVDDDIFDSKERRYNKPTWYKVNGVGVNKAILDGAFLDAGIWFLLIKHLSSHKHFQAIMKQILLTFATTNIAQRIDMTKRKVADLDKFVFTPKAYGIILPVLRTALFLANIDDKDAHAATENISKDVTNFLKVENDVNDVFDPLYPFNSIKEAYTDISEGKSSWLALQAYSRGTSAQKKLLEENYGKNDEEAIQKCYDLFNDLNLKEVFMNYKEEFYNTTFLKIHKELPKILPKELFVDFLNLAMTKNFTI
uniref:Farnesyl pyrophosphate synthase-like n=1 Tax=Diabrotica virgifera virgifera TaxID=50390 RepID=A0A6P7GWH2_DIAVI